MKKQSKMIVGVVALVVVVAVFLGIYYGTREATVEGAKTITMTVVHGDGSENAFTINTDAEYLADALLDEGIVEDNQTEWGLYIITADGETVDEAQEQWWCLTQDGEMTSTGASETVIEDGDSFALIFTEGYDY